MTDKEVLDAVIRKFKKAKKRENYESKVSACSLCQEICGEKRPTNLDLLGGKCDKCAIKFGGLFGFKGKYRFHHCLGATIAGISLSEALDDDDQWKIFRRKYIKYLKAKRAEL